MKTALSTLAVLAAIAAPALAETENPAICAQLAGKPGLYLVRSTSDIRKLPVSGPQRLQSDIRVYVIPPETDGNDEKVVHARITTTATAENANTASSVRLRRNTVASSCRQSLFSAGKPDFDNDDDGKDSDVHDYNDFSDNISRSSKSLNEWHFRWQAGRDKSRCQYTGDHVPKLDGVGARKAKPLVKIASVGSAAADKPSGLKAASLTSVLVHQPNKGAACFAFRLFQRRDTGWTPQLSRIETWTFSDTPGRAQKRVFTVNWTP